MRLDTRTLTSLTVPYRFRNYLRTSPLTYRSTPLGLGGGNARFSSPNGNFKELYLAADLPTSIAEGVIRDRFDALPEDRRFVLQEEVERWGLTAVRTKTPLRLLDLRFDGAYRLGIPSDAIRAADHGKGQMASEEIYRHASIDGILYASRMTGRVCCMVYDRALSKLAHTPMVDLVTVARLVPALDSLDITLLA